MTALHLRMLLIALLTGAFGALASTTAGGVVAHVAPGSGVEVVAARPPLLAAHVSPTRIRIPAIGVDADVEAVGREADGALSVPEDGKDAGWDSEGVVPGEKGPAVVVGHVDSAREGPAVFFRLPSLHSGDEVIVDLGDGETRHFTVERTQRFPKANFPTGLVYGPTPLPELRLVTCTGTFDQASRNYLDNLIVTAHLAT